MVAKRNTLTLKKPPAPKVVNRTIPAYIPVLPPIPLGFQRTKK